MAILAEELVEEWLNRQGYFTIRGIKVGVHEIDLLAVRVNGKHTERRHIEVQASVRPVSYLTKVPKEIQKTTGRAAGSAKTRATEELRLGVREWAHKKFLHKRKDEIRQRLSPGRWTKELVVHKLRHPEEAALIEQEGIVIHHLSDIVEDLKRGDAKIESAAGSDFVDLVLLE